MTKDSRLRASLPKGEIVWKRYGGGAFIETSDPFRLKYSLWKRENEHWLLIASGKTPERFSEIVRKEVY